MPLAEVEDACMATFEHAENTWQDDDVCDMYDEGMREVTDTVEESLTSIQLFGWQIGKARRCR
jgi:hypothetical protein